MNNKKLLLHTCCAPCFCYPFQQLKNLYFVTAYFYNPNIDPLTEYEKRYHELFKYSKLENFELIKEDYTNTDWEAHVGPYQHLGERSERCWICYRIRLEKTFQYAIQNEYEIVGTVLSISPHKNSIVLNKIGNELSCKYKIKYLEADFKKKDGFKKSVQLSKDLNFFRQNYCGCKYSKNERLKSAI